MSKLGKIIPSVSSRNFGLISAAVSSAKSSRSYFTYTQELSQPLDRHPECLSAKEAFQICLKSGKLYFTNILNNYTNFNPRSNVTHYWFSYLFNLPVFILRVNNSDPGCYS